MRIEDILEELQKKYNLTKAELERIIDSQFKFTHTSIEAKTTKSIKLANLGKIKPSKYLIDNYDRLVKKV